jgi:uncharacterized membrane protein YraQ (UPF0718 family)
MLIPTVILGIFALALVFIGYRQGAGAHVAGLRAGGKMILETLPLLVFAFVAAGMIPALIPKDLIARWIGGGSGWRGILVGTVAGGFSPGGPYVSLPLAAGFMRTGAGVGTMVAFLTGWSLWAVARLPMEFGVMGWRFTLVRLACTFFFPPIAGFLAQGFFGSVRI